MIVWLFLLLGFGRVPQTHTVEIRGMEFHPAALTAAVGDTVVWINRDIVPHTATAKGSAGWDTGSLVASQSGRYVVRHNGVAHYACTFHPTMHGTLTVR